MSLVAAPKHGRPDWPHIKMNEQGASLCHRELDLKMLIETCVVLNDTPLPLKRYYTLVPPDKGSLSSRSE